MDRIRSGRQRRDAAQSTSKGGPDTAKVEASLASREESIQIRQRLLKMIVENEEKRRNTAVTNQV